MAEPWCLEKGRHIISKQPPPGLDKDSKLEISLDEFFLFDSKIKVMRQDSRETQQRIVDIEDACKHFRKRGPHPACFIIHISSHDRLDPLFKLPKVVEEKSLFHNYWPAKHFSNYLRQRNKLFYACWEGYVSPPVIAYGGATEWLYIISGSLELTLIEPTDLNLCKYSQFNDGEEFKPISNTSAKFVLDKETFMMIPAGYITVKRALRATWAYGGEMLHGDNLPSQVESFEGDIVRTAGKFAHERDSEIRHMYWFYASHLLQVSHKYFNKASEEATIALRKCLAEWRIKFKKADPTTDPYIQPNLFAPFGLDLDAIVKDLRRRAPNTPKKSQTKSSDS